MKAVTIISGGMDSATLAYFNQSIGFEQRFISFNYGQRHVKELEAAKKISQHLCLPHNVIDISTIRPLLHGSSQTDDEVKVPEGHYEEDNMRLTVIPNRNAIMLAIAYAAAVADGATSVTYGAHAGDHFIYPDCRPSFIKSLSQALYEGNVGFQNPDLHIFAPFETWSKADILRWGLMAGVPYELTWTCYKGGEIACGRCGCCVERLQSFAENKVEDPIQYEDRNFWKEAVEKYNEHKESKQ